MVHVLRSNLASHSMRFPNTFFVLCLTISTSTIHAAPASLLLAENGKALQPIVISDKATDSTKKVAAELADCLNRITSTKFTVETGDSSRGIVLGTLAEFPTPELNDALAIKNTYDGKEAFAIRTEAKRCPNWRQRIWARLMPRFVFSNRSAAAGSFRTRLGK